MYAQHMLSVCYRVAMRRLRNKGGEGMKERVQAMEEQIAHLVRAIEDLSDVVAAQAGEIDRLTRQVSLLLGREADREAEGGGAVVLADQRPPHW